MEYFTIKLTWWEITPTEDGVVRTNLHIDEEMDTSIYKAGRQTFEDLVERNETLILQNIEKYGEKEWLWMYIPYRRIALYYHTGKLVEEWDIGVWFKKHSKQKKGGKR